MKQTTAILCPSNCPVPKQSRQQQIPNYHDTILEMPSQVEREYTDALAVTVEEITKEAKANDRIIQTT